MFMYQVDVGQLLRCAEFCLPSCHAAAVLGLLQATSGCVQGLGRQGCADVDSTQERQKKRQEGIVILWLKPAVHTLWECEDGMAEPHILLRRRCM
jgi:hypothetical protein